MYYPELTNAEGKCLIDCIIKAKHPTTDNISDRTDEESEMYDSLIEKIQQSGDDTTIKNFVATVHIIKNNMHRDVGIAVFAFNMQNAIKIVERLFGPEIADEVIVTAIQEFTIRPGCLVQADDSMMPELYVDKDDNEEGAYVTC